jgi:DNA-binding transcriptional regulator YhcF (GntR family)
MYEKDKKYHVKIPVNFLVKSTGIFKSKYTKWIYVFLKLKFNIYIHKKPNTFYKIDVNEIAQLFRINKATVFDCFNELKKYGLLEKSGKGLYKLCKESEMTDLEIDTKVFIPIYYNWFIDFWYKGITPELADVYFYLINENRHHLDKDYLIKISVNQAKLCRDLRLNPRTFKKCKKILTRLNYLYKCDNNIYTVKQGPDFDNEALEQAKNNLQMTKEQLCKDTNNNHTNRTDDIIEKLKKLKIIKWKYIPNGEYAIPVLNGNHNLPFYDYNYRVKKESFEKYGVFFEEKSNSGW